MQEIKTWREIFYHRNDGEFKINKLALRKNRQLQKVMESIPLQYLVYEDFDLVDFFETKSDLEFEQYVLEEAIKEGISCNNRN